MAEAHGEMSARENQGMTAPGRGRETKGGRDRTEDPETRGLEKQP